MAVERNSSSRPWLGVVVCGSLCLSEEDSEGGDGALMRDHPEEVWLVYPGGRGGRREVLGVGARLGCPKPLRPFCYDLFPFLLIYLLFCLSLCTAPCLAFFAFLCTCFIAYLCVVLGHILHDT